MVSGFELTISDAASFEHANGGFGFDAKTSVIEIMHVDNFFDAGLDDGFRTLDAREIVNIDTGALKFAHVAAEVENGVEFGVANVGVFRVVVIFGFAVPGEVVVVEIVGRAIVTN